MATELIVNASLPETRVALLEESEIQEILIERGTGKGIVGNIYKGRVTRVLPGMQAAFVDIGLEKAAFLYVDDVYVHSNLFESEEEEQEEEGNEESAGVITAGLEEAQEEEGEEESAALSSEEVPSEGSDSSIDASIEVSVEEPLSTSEDSAANSETVGNRLPTPRSTPDVPDTFHQQVSEDGEVLSDRASLQGIVVGTDAATVVRQNASPEAKQGLRQKFREPRGRDRRIKTKSSMRPQRAQVNINDLLTEGQEVIVQVAKDPIATKGARLTCHISLPGRHLVCMPTIDHVGVSRRIERDDERRRLRDFVDRNRPKKLGFIVRTATAGNKQTSENRIQQDIDYLSQAWDEIKEKSSTVQAPAMIYEDLNPFLRAIRDWVNEDIDKIVIDSRFQYNEAVRFVKNFMPTILSKVELYQGDIPIFDAYGISPELSRSLERKVWLKSGGSIVIDQAEALVAIDVNTGRFVGKKNLEDTILKTNLEAVKEIAYQLRLRNCGGIIILDLIDMEREEHKFRVYRALEEELKKDRARPQILKISELGLIEMTRKRTRDTLVRMLCDSCSHCEGKGYVKNKLTVAYEVLRDLERAGIDREVNKILVQAHSDVIDTLAIDERETLDQLERRFRKSIYLQAVADFHPEQYEVVNEKKNQTEKSDEQILDRARESTHGQDNRGRSPRRDRFSRKSGGSNGGRNERNDRGDRGDRNADRDRSSERERSPERERSDAPISLPQPLAQPIQPLPVPVSVVVPQIQNQSADYSVASSEDGDAIGNRVQPVRPVVPAAGDDFFSEEDRLAFIRAQAAQDAAIASLGSEDRPGGGYSGAPRNQGFHKNGGKNRFGQPQGKRPFNGGGRNNRNYRGGKAGGRYQGGTNSNKPAVNVAPNDDGDRE